MHLTRLDTGFRRYDGGCPAIAGKCSFHFGFGLVSLYQAMVNRFVAPVIEAHEARGRAEGVEIGRAAERTEWQEWNRRRMDAEARGRPFDEPPPGD